MFDDISLFLKSISFVDCIFFFTVVFLIVLVICLIYFIKVNEAEIKKEKLLDDPESLKQIAGAIEKEEEKKPVTFTSYEKEQEEKAIISYDELLSNTGKFNLNYSNEEQKGDLLVKQFDLENLTVKAPEENEIKETIHLLSLEREEEFLKALKELYKGL